MLKVYGYDGLPFDPERHCSAMGDRFIRAMLKIVPSGNYATHGDTLDLTNGGGTAALPSCIPPAVSSLAQLFIDGRGPQGGFTQAGGFTALSPVADTPLTFADVAALKLTFWKNVAGAVTEYAAGAYGNDVLNDAFVAEAIWAR
jgi:hypothetical protein